MLALRRIFCLYLDLSTRGYDVKCMHYRMTVFEKEVLSFFSRLTANHFNGRCRVVFEWQRLARAAALSLLPNTVGRVAQANHRP
jgi:hypothetical protein